MKNYVPPEIRYFNSLAAFSVFIGRLTVWLFSLPP